jgi:hypothetical protein
MNLILFLSYFMQAATFATAVVLLVLQFRAFRRHGHVSFAMLSASTVGAILYFLMWVIMGLLAYKAVRTPLWLYLSATAFLLLQIVMGTWGTISLFKSYRYLSDKVPAGAEGAIPSLQANGAPETETPQEPKASVPSTPVDANPALLQRLNNIFRLWLLRPSSNISGMATEPWILALALLTLGFWLALNWLQAGPDRQFSSFNVPALAFYVLLALGVALIASRASTPRIPYRSTLYITVSVVPFLIGVWWLINTRILSAFPILELALGVYAFAYAALNLRRLAGGWQLRSTALLLLTCGIFYTADQESYWSASLWYSAPPDSEKYVPHQAETLFFD